MYAIYRPNTAVDEFIIVAAQDCTEALLKAFKIINGSAVILVVGVQQCPHKAVFSTSEGDFLVNKL